MLRVEVPHRLWVSCWPWSIVEYEAHGTVIPTGAPLHQTIIAVMRIRNGLVASYRDYLNPLVLAETLASVGNV